MIARVRSLLPWLPLLVGCSVGPQPASSATASSSGPADTSTTLDPPLTTSGTLTPPTTTDSTSGSTPATSSTTDTSSSTTDTSSSTTGVSSSSTGDPAPPVHCRGGEPLFQLPELTEDEGLELCPDGQIHRHTAVECVHPLAIDPCQKPMGCSEPCDELGDGVCSTYLTDFCTCQYPCTTDADCPSDAACLCKGGLPVDGGIYEFVQTSQCVRANCHTDADCGEFLCALSPSICGYGTVHGMFCHTAEDECVGDQECLDKQIGNLCAFESSEQRWKCMEQAFCE